MKKSNQEKVSLIIMVIGIMVFAIGVAYHPRETADDTQGPLVIVGLILTIVGLRIYLADEPE